MNFDINTLLPQNMAAAALHGLSAAGGFHPPSGFPFLHSVCIIFVERSIKPAKNTPDSGSEKIILKTGNPLYLRTPGGAAADETLHCVPDKHALIRSLKIVFICRGKVSS